MIESRKDMMILIQAEMTIKSYRIQDILYKVHSSEIFDICWLPKEGY